MINWFKCKFSNIKDFFYECCVSFLRRKWLNSENIFFSILFLHIFMSITDIRYMKQISNWANFVVTKKFGACAWLSSFSYGLWAFYLFGFMLALLFLFFNISIEADGHNLLETSLVSHQQKFIEMNLVPQISLTNYHPPRKVWLATAF